MTRYWMLPEDVIELLPQEASHIEGLRRKLLDNMALWGYELVKPPLVEFLDSLLAGSENLDIQTFKITDQASGRLMGVRADLTPQIARIDAHRMAGTGTRRFAYCGDVLRTRSESTQPRRNPLIVGAELYGVANVSGDMEVMGLLLDCMNACGVEQSVLDIGHSAIFAGLVAVHGLSAEDSRAVKEAISGVQRPALSQWQVEQRFSAACLADIAFLLDAPLYRAGLTDLTQQFGGRHALFDQAIADLEAAEAMLRAAYPQQEIVVDVSSIGTYGYHSGLVFALYAQGHYDALARGGRYDGLGEVYGKARSATGFSIDLLTLGQLLPLPVSAQTAEKQAWSQNSKIFQDALSKRRSGIAVIFEHEGES